MKRLAIAVLCAGCGRYDFGLLDGATARGDDGMDAPDPGCWPHWLDGSVTIDPPTAIAELNTSETESDASLTEDGLTLYFAHLTIYSQIWSATRTARGMPWMNAAPVAALSSSGNDSKVGVDASNTLIVFPSDRAMPGNTDLYEATRATPALPFDMPDPSLYAQDNTTQSQWDPHLSGDALTLYYSYGPSGAVHIARTTRVSRTSSFALPVTLSELEIGTVTADPVPSPDELVILFSTQVGASVDIYFGTRASLTDAFGNFRPVPTVNDPIYTDNDPELSADGCELFFSSTRAGAAEMGDLFTATVH